MAKGMGLGTRYELRPPTVVLGNGLTASEGLNLAVHEPAGPRRMDARQAARVRQTTRTGW